MSAHRRCVAWFVVCLLLTPLGLRIADIVGGDLVQHAMLPSPLTVLPAFTSSPPRPHIVTEKNDIGVWHVCPTCRKDATKDVLIVIGGVVGVDETVDVLLGEGFTVWQPRVVCNNTGRMQRNCKENWGYLHYISDTTEPRKPRRRATAFLHGHLRVNKTAPGVLIHQRGDLITTILSIAKCAIDQNKYISFDEVHFKRYWEDMTPNAVTLWNNLVKARPINATKLMHYCCGQFVVPESLIDAEIEGVAGVLKEYMVQSVESDSWFFEFTYHILFREAPIIAGFSQPQCPSEVHENHSKFSHFIQGATQNLVVLGSRRYSTKLLSEIVDLGHSVFYPRQTSRPLCIGDTPEGSEYAVHCDSAERGYLQFLMEKEVPKLISKIVFIDGRGAVTGRNVTEMFEALGEKRFVAFPEANHLASIQRRAVEADLRKRFKPHFSKFQARSELESFTDFALPTTTLHTLHEPLLDAAFLYHDQAMGDPTIHQYFWRFLFEGPPLHMMTKQRRRR